MTAADALTVVAILTGINTIILFAMFWMQRVWAMRVQEQADKAARLVHDVKTTLVRADEEKKEQGGQLVGEVTDVLKEKF